MAETSVPAGLTVQQWDDVYFRDFINKNWFKKFMGTGSSSMIQVREDLTKKPGDAITVTLVNKLTGAAKGENETLEGNEEDAMLRSHKIQVREYKHAVKWSDWQEQLTAIDLRQAHRDVLMDWNMELDRDNIIKALMSINGKVYADASENDKDAWLVDNQDRAQFGKLRSNYSAGDHSAALATIDNTDDKMTPSALSVMKRLAKTANPKVRPFKVRDSIEASDAYVVFAPSLQIRDLVNDPVFVQANREARDRGSKNPLFNAADYLWDNLAIFEIEDIPVISNGTINVAPCFLCGAQALAQVWAKRPQTVTDQFDYESKNGLAVKQWYKIEKLRFGTGDTDTDDAKDHGLVTGWFAAVGDA